MTPNNDGAPPRAGLEPSRVAPRAARSASPGPEREPGSTTAADMASLLNHHDGSLSVGPGCVADEGFVAGAEFAAKNAELLHGSQGHPPPGFTLSRRIAVGWARNS
jgi:hypothetical protein